MVVFILCRFFSSCSSAASVSVKECAREDPPQDVEPTAVNQDTSPNSQTNDSDGPDIPSVDTPSPPPSPSTTSPCSASQGLKLFRWSGSSCSADQNTPQSAAGLAALQQFHYKKESSSSSSKTHTSSGDTSLPPPSPTDPDPEKKEDLPDSPPSQDSAYFTQSQPQPTSCHKEEVLTCNFSSSYQEEAVRSYTFPLPFEMCMQCLWSHTHHQQSSMAHEWVCRKLFV